MTGVATCGRSYGSSELSQSMKHTTSLVATRKPAKHAAPKPRAGSVTTRAPRFRATLAEPSFDPLSTTIGS